MVIVEPQRQFAENLRRYRLRAGLSQEALGLRCGLDRTEVGKLERGERQPRLETIVKVARGLDVKPAQLLRGIE